MKTYPAVAGEPQFPFAGRFIFLVAGLLLASTSIVIAGLNGWNRGATLLEAIIWAGAGAVFAWRYIGRIDQHGLAALPCCCRLMCSV